jgi:heme-degrading monooxygenase HmoA
MSDSEYAQTPEPPYWAVIFTSKRTVVDEGYLETAAEMERLAAEQPGYLGIESARDAGLGLTVSYWASDEAARGWKRVAEHLDAQRRGREHWYESYEVRVAKVERAYGWQRAPR